MSLRAVAVAVCALSFGVSSAQAADVLVDPLNGSTTGQQKGGSFEAGGGWRAGQQIHWDLGVELSEGGMSVELTNWDPNTTSSQHQFDKQHILNMYQSAAGSPHKADAENPKTAFFNIRTGATYDNLFKLLSSTAGFDPPPNGRYETRIKKALGFVKPANTYTVKVEWTKAGSVTAWLDAEQLVTHTHSAPLRLRHVFIGTDNAPPGTYGPQKDVVYKNLKVWGSTAPPLDAGAGGTGGSSGAGGSADGGGGTPGGGAGGSAGGGGWGAGALDGGAGAGAAPPLSKGSTAAQDEGCSCRTPSSGSSGAGAWLTALLVAMGWGRRRRHRH